MTKHFCFFWEVVMAALQKILSGLNGKSKTITAAAILIAASSLASRFLGVIRDRLLVGAFGVGDRLDIYYASFQIPNFVYNLLILGTLSVAFIPVFAQYWAQQEHEEAWEITNTILNTTIIVMGVICVILFLTAGILSPWIAPGFSGEKLSDTIALTRLMLLSPILFAMNAVVGSVLTATKRFISVALGPLIYNLSIIAGILWLAPRWGIWGVGISVVVGALLYFVLQFVTCLALGYRYGFDLNLRHTAVRTVGALFFPRIWGMDGSQISLLIGTMIGSTFVAGSVAIFNLAVNIQSVPIGVLAVPFVIAVFPTLTEAVATKQFAQYVAAFSYAARQMLFFLLPVTVLTVVLRAHVVRLIIGTQQLSWDDTRLAAASLGIFAIGFVAQAMTPLLSRAFYALKDTIRPVTASLLSIIVNVATTLAVVYALAMEGPFLDMVKSVMRLEGVADIRVLALPVGFTVSALFNMGVLAVWLRIRFGALDYPEIVKRAVPISVASLLAGGAAYGTLNLMVPLVTTHTIWGVFGQLVVASLVGFVTYALASLIFKSKEMWQFIRSLERRMIKIVGPVDISGAEEL